MSLPAWRMDPARYAFTKTFELRYGDLDSQSHLHEIATLRILEATRFHFLRQLNGTPAAAVIENVTAELTFESFHQADRSSELLGTASVLRVGKSSFVVANALFSSGHCLAVSDVVHVTIDANNRPRPLLDCDRMALQAWLPAASDRL